MAVTANTNETYDVSTIREDLQDALISISPTETPFMSAVGRRNVSNTYFEWPVIELAAASASNVVASTAIFFPFRSFFFSAISKTKRKTRW